MSAFDPKLPLQIHGAAATRSGMLSALKRAWLNIKLVRRTQTAHDMAAGGENRLALQYLEAMERSLGPLTQYTFGIEPTLLGIFVRGCVDGIKADDYDWVALQNLIEAAAEYNDAEKLHLLAYLEELATTAGVSLPASPLFKRPAPTERVSSHLKRRFPKLSEA